MDGQFDTLLRVRRGFILMGGCVTALDDSWNHDRAMSDKPKKTKKPKRPAPVLPRGFRDIEGTEARAVAAMLAKVSDVFERYGFERIGTPF